MLFVGERGAGDGDRFGFRVTAVTDNRTMYKTFMSKVNLRGAAIAVAVLLLSACSSSEERAQSYYEHGKQLFAAHDYQRAEIEFRNAVKYNRNLLPAWQSLAEVEELTRNWSAMIPTLRTIVELNANDTSARLKLGKLLLASGAFNDALKVVNDAKDADSQNPDLLALKALVLFKLNDSKGSIDQAQAALKIDPSNSSAMFVIAGNDYAQGDTTGALAILNNSVMSQRTDLGIELFKVQVLEKAQNLQQAEALVQKLTEQYPKEMAFKKELIRLYVLQKDFDDAEKEQRAIIATLPTNVQAHLDLVRLLGATKGAAAAQQELETLIKAGGDVFSYQIALADLEFSQRRVSDAVALLKSLIADTGSPDHVIAAQINLAQIYLNEKQLDPAAALVADVLNKDGRNTAGLAIRAGIRIERGELEGAISDLRQALNDQPRAANLMLLLATAYERDGSIDLAEKEFADAMRASDYNPTVSLNYATFLQRRGSMALAEDVLTDLATRWPKNGNVLSALAQVRLARQEWEGAQQVAEAIKALGADQSVGNELLGAALAGRNKLDESIGAFQNAYAEAPASAQPMSALVAAYMRAGKTDQAVTFLQSVLKANPSNAEAYVLLGSVQLANKTPDQARQSFMTAIDKEPTSFIGYNALASFYLTQNNADEAIKTARDGLEKVPESFDLHMTLATILERTGDYAGAITEYQHLHDKDPGSLVVNNNLASLLADHRTDAPSLDEAKALAAALNKSPLPQFKDTVGWVSYRQGDYQTALPLLAAAAAALPNLALVRYHLGMTYAAVGEPGKAVEQFKAALNDAPGHDLEEQIRAALTKNSTQ